jgi:hypothetical protein
VDAIRQSEIDSMSKYILICEEASIRRRLGPGETVVYKGHVLQNLGKSYLSTKGWKFSAPVIPSVLVLLIQIVTKKLYSTYVGRSSSLIISSTSVPIDGELIMTKELPIGWIKAAKSISIPLIAKWN